ncbi:MAG: hypothetical protein KF789_07640 [Bdellovibrionaceae bacterium]|nr:hypothetical protein [Pseudobdellovibrionaceae bacterium]
MEASPCCSCQKSKAPLQCGLCSGALCKGCAQFVEEGRFSYDPSVSEDLTKGVYCPACYDGTVLPALHAYDELMAKARNVSVYFKTQSKETRLMKRNQQALEVHGCPDREEALLRLAFLSAKAGFGTLLDVDLTAEKVRQGAYQTSVWKGTGVPFQKD